MSYTARCGAGLLIAFMISGCNGSADQPAEEEIVSAPTIEQVLAAHTDSLMALPGVVGTAIGLCDDVPCIYVYLADSSEAVRRSVPDSLEGYHVQTEISGVIRPRDT